MPEGYEVKTVKVYGDTYAKQVTHPTVAYERTVRTKEVTWVCAQCGKQVKQWRYPGPLPRYCGEECSREAQRDQTRARVQRLRARATS